MNVSEAHAYIRSLHRRGIKYELTKIRRLVQLLDNPHERLRWIHITGTNGKGSVAAMLEGLLRARGLKVGLFTSPHLVSIVERWRVDGRNMTGEEFAAHLTELRPHIERMGAEPDGPPTFFEICMAMACRFFLEQRCDVVVCEVGLGGRLDATNVITPLVSVITNVGVDHTKTLGPTEADICREKCGIIKPGRPVLCGVRQPELRAMVAEAAAGQGAPLHFLDEYAASDDVAVALGRGTSFRLTLGGRTRRLTTPLLGRHQASNAACAVAAANLLPDDLRPAPALWQRGLSRTWWDGRFQVMGRRRPVVVLDGGHNVDGATVLADTWSAVFPGRTAHLVAGFSGDKQIRDMLGLLAPLAASVTFARSDNYRAADPARLVESARQLYPDLPMQAEADPARALAAARRAAGPDGLVLVTGSLYLLGNVLGVLRRVKPD